jgi:hypothetical protein
VHPIESYSRALRFISGAASHFEVQEMFNDMDGDIARFHIVVRAEPPPFRIRSTGDSSASPLTCRPHDIAAPNCEKRMLQ